jgi:hypothetical protein
MPIESRNTLKSYFETGDIPTADQFANLIESQVNLADDGISVDFAPDKSRVIGLEYRSNVARLNLSGIQGRFLSLYPAKDSKDFWLLRDTTLVKTESMVASEMMDVTSNEMATRAPGGLEILHSTDTEKSSRLFIQRNGNVGMGTITPFRKLELSENNPNEITGIRFTNMAVATGYGWSVGHLQNGDKIKDSSFRINEDGDMIKDTVGVERFTILRGGNVGINVSLPDTKLHVSRALADPNTPIDLREGTGIAMFGPEEENVLFDSSGVQARVGTLIENKLAIRFNTLNIQPLGGAVLLHGDDSLHPSTRVIITESGSFGIGTTAPVERIDVDGAIKIGSTNNGAPTAGTIRWSGEDFQGYNGTAWKSFTEGSQVWSTVQNSDTIYYAPADPRVGIGTDDPSAALHVYENTAVSTASDSTNSIAAYVRNNSSSNNTGITDLRVGIQVDCDGLWSGVDGPTNIALYVRDVNGQTLSNENFAAVLNGNVVVGNVNGTHLVGTDGARVLTIQNGTAPSSAAGDGTTTAGVQVYSANRVSGGISISTIHAMNGDGKVVKLYEEAALPAAVNTALTSTPTFGDVEKSVLENLRARVNALEARLKAFGLLPA